MFSTKQTKYTGLFCLLLLLLNLPLRAAGVLDPSFGNSGKVNFGFSDSPDDLVSAAVLQPDGKIVIVGTSGRGGQSNGFNKFAVARLNADGTLDNTFGSGGLVTTDFAVNIFDGANAVAIQPDGKIVVGGSRQTVESNSNAFALARYNADGSLDAMFSGGKVITDFPDIISEFITQLSIQPDGKIIALGSGMLAPDFRRQTVLVRYNSNGTLDASFGNNGKFDLPQSAHGGIGQVMQPDGKILFAGSQSYQIAGCVPTHHGPSCSGAQPLLMRYNPQMTLDRKFGRRLGKEFLSLETPTYGISLQTDGSILVNGEVNRRYTTSGRLEMVFDQAIISNQPLRTIITAQKPDGKFVGCGAGGSNGYDDIAVALFSASGRLIGTDQRDFFGGNDSCKAILPQSDGKFLIVGSAQTAPQSGYTFAVTRYLDITP